MPVKIPELFQPGVRGQQILEPPFFGAKCEVTGRDRHDQDSKRATNWTSG